MKKRLKEMTPDEVIKELNSCKRELVDEMNILKQTNPSLSYEELMSQSVSNILDVESGHEKFTIGEEFITNLTINDIFGDEEYKYINGKRIHRNDVIIKDNTMIFKEHEDFINYLNCFPFLEVIDDVEDITINLNDRFNTIYSVSFTRGISYNYSTKNIYIDKEKQLSIDELNKIMIPITQYDKFVESRDLLIKLYDYKDSTIFYGQKIMYGNLIDYIFNDINMNQVFIKNNIRNIILEKVRNYKDGDVLYKEDLLKILSYEEYNEYIFDLGNGTWCVDKDEYNNDLYIENIVNELKEII